MMGSDPSDAAPESNGKEAFERAFVVVPGAELP